MNEKSLPDVLLLTVSVANMFYSLVSSLLWQTFLSGETVNAGRFRVSGRVLSQSPQHAADSGRHHPPYGQSPQPLPPLSIQICPSGQRQGPATPPRESCLHLHLRRSRSVICFCGNQQTNQQMPIDFPHSEIMMSENMFGCSGLISCAVWRLSVLAIWCGCEINLI